MKIALIAITVLCIFDAVVWKGAYRTALVHAAVVAGRYVTDQKWAWLS